MTATSNPFGNRPTKPQVVRLGDRRIAVFIGAAYQFTDDAGAASLRNQLDIVLQPSPRAEALGADSCESFEIGDLVEEVRKLAKAMEASHG